MPKQYKIEGNHPVLKRIDWLATGIPDLICKLKELDKAGYEIKIKTIK